MQTNKKHLLGRLLAFLAVAFVTTGMAWAQVSVSVSSVTGRPGETITVPVNISNVTSVNSFQFTVNTGTDLTYAGYDATGTLAAGFALSPSATTSGTSVTVGGFNNSGAPGAITADGTLLNLSFTLGASASTGNVSLDATEFDGVAPAGGASVAVPYVISTIFIDAVDSTVRLTDPAAITVNAVDAVTNLAAFTVDVTVGPEFGGPVTISAGTLTSAWGNQFSINPLGGDVYRVGGFGTPATGTGSLFVLNGTAAVIGTRAVTFSNLDFTDNTGGNIPVGADSGTFTVEANAAPTATAQTVTLDEDDSSVITLAGTDANGDALTFAIASGPTNGTLSAVTGATVTYTPTANYNGPDSFTFTASDGLATSAAATVSITVNAVNDVPTVTDPPATTTAEDTDATITLTGSDDDGDALTFAVATAPANGSVVITGNTATYTPNANYNGADSFTFTASDGTATSAAGTASITVTAVNDAPVVADDTIATAEDTDGTVTLTSTDVEGDAVTYSVGTAPTNGTVTIAGDVATYSPNANYNGGDTFTVVGNDGTDDSAPATITVTVTAVNDAPTASAIAQTTAEDTAADVTLLGADVDGDALTYTVSAATNGTVTVAGDVATYTPTADFAGADSFTYTVSDGTLSATETVTMTVTPSNDAPVVADGTIATDEDTDGTATLTSTDADGDAVTYSVGTAPTNGTVTIAGDVATYSPNANYNGGDSFTVVGNDGTVDSAPATITVTVAAVNDAPTATAIAQTTAEDSAADVTLLGADVDGDALTYTVSAATSGTVTVAGDVATYTPNADFNGTDSFTYTVSDGTLSATETVSMTVSATNDAPVVDDLAAASDEDNDASVTLTGTDTEGDAITFAIDTAPTNGTVALTGAEAVYTPNADFNGTDSFTYTGSDGTDTSAAATVTVTVNAVNDAPVFTAELADMTILEDAPLNFTYVATDVDGDALTFNVVSPATATIDGSGAFSWSAVGSVGSNAVQVSVSDGTVTVESTIATVMVLPVDGFRLNFAGVHENPPVATPASGSGMIRVVESDGTLEISATVEGLSGAFAAAHIHSAPVGENGPVLLSLTGVPSPDGRSVTFNQTIDLATSLPAGTTPADFIASLRAGQAYVNVHSSAHGSGEVRSQILAADNQAPSAVAVRAPSDVTISGNGDDRLYSVSWLPATDPNGDAVNYIYQVSLTAGFSEIEGAINFGDGNGFRVTVAEAAALYDEVTDANPGMVDVGGSVTLYHRMVTTDGGLWTAGPVESITLTRGTVTANEGEVDLPTEFALKGNYPNPFNPSTSIQFDLPEAADVTVVVSDMLGRQVLSVPSATLEAGSNRSIQVDASGLASGLYLYRVVARSAQTTFAKVGTMTLIK